MMLQINLFETEIPEHLTFLKLTLKLKLYWLKFRVISLLGIDDPLFYMPDYIVVVARLCMIYFNLI